MKKCCIVPCGKKKREGFHPAKDLYIGNYAKTMIEYAEKFHKDDYLIISAKYGFVRPDEVIESYDVTIRDNDAISDEELYKQVKEKGLINYDTWILLCGENYYKKIEKVLRRLKAEGFEIRVERPLKGLRQGEQIKRVKDAIAIQKRLDDITE